MSCIALGNDKLLNISFITLHGAECNTYGEISRLMSYIATCRNPPSIYKFLPVAANLASNRSWYDCTMRSLLYASSAWGEMVIILWSLWLIHWCELRRCRLHTLVITVITPCILAVCKKVRASSTSRCAAAHDSAACTALNGNNSTLRLFF